MFGLILIYKMMSIMALFSLHNYSRIFSVVLHSRFSFFYLPLFALYPSRFRPRPSVLFFLFPLFIIFFHPTPVFAVEKEIEKIQFLGARFSGESDLIDIIQSEEGDEFEPRILKLDKILLTNYYKKNGFLDVFVEDSLAPLLKNQNVILIYRIHEGLRYHFNGARFKGASEIPVSKLALAFKEIKLNSPFDESQVTLASKQVEDIYYNNGKPFVQIDVSYLFEHDSLITVLLLIMENQTVFIKEVRYSGQEKVSAGLIKRELTVKAGQKYNRNAMEESQQNLYSTGLFRYVRFEIEPAPVEPDQAILKVMVSEKDPRWVGVRFGLAHEQETSYGNKFELTFQGGHRNLFSSGRSASLYLTPSLMYDLSENKLHNPDNKIGLMFIEPWVAGTHTPGIIQFSYEQYRHLNAGWFDLWRTSFDLRRKPSRVIELSASLAAKLVDRLSDADIDSLTALRLDVNKSEVYSLTLYSKRDTRANIFNPIDDSYIDFSVSFSYTRGRDELNKVIINRYFTFISSWQRYQPWRPKVFGFKRWEFSFATRLKAGAILEPGKNGKIPINDRFFAGGANTVRGYQEQLLGPPLTTDSKGHIKKAAGGKLLTLANVEARMPLYWLFVLETFIDGGYVWGEVSDFNPMDFKVTAGLGLAVITPLGPVRVDYGYKLMRSSLDPTPDAFHLGIYFAF